ncbi:MAG: Deoxyribodipyrimidine photo-lyase [Holosporales bacterium]
MPLMKSTLKDKVTIVLFKYDCRLCDNPALWHAAQEGWVIPVFIKDEKTPQAFAYTLLKTLKNTAIDMWCYTGDPFTILQALIKKYNVDQVYWNRRYDAIDQDTQLKANLKNFGVHVKTFKGTLLFEPFEICKNDGSAYKVFTPFYKACLAKTFDHVPLAAPASLKIPLRDEQAKTPDDLGFSYPWQEKLEGLWAFGEDAAQKTLSDFLENTLRDYKAGRDFPALMATSRLSYHLAVGSISPRQIHASLAGYEAEAFVRELYWREFSYHLLFHHPEMRQEPFQKKFTAFPWEFNEEHFSAWKKGETGYPIVDAGMRELWQTGYMHNRVRMIVGSFLVKNLLIHWHHGMAWFFDCLLDADFANNTASWQWIAGCGADAAPYFRIFNPTTQAEKFDPDGRYIRKFIPELRDMPNAYIFTPWQAPRMYQASAYPAPIVDLAATRQRALDAYTHCPSF